jgi:hypothetical protein
VEEPRACERGRNLTVAFTPRLTYLPLDYRAPPPGEGRSARLKTDAPSPRPVGLHAILPRLGHRADSLSGLAASALAKSMGCHVTSTSRSVSSKPLVLSSGADVFLPGELGPEGPEYTFS